MDAKIGNTHHSFLKRVLIVALTIIIIVGFWTLRSLWMLGFASIVIAVGISIPVTWLQRHGMPRGAAVFTSAFGVIVGAVALMLLVVLPMTTEITEVLPQSQNVLINAGEVYDRWRSTIPLLANFLPARDSSEILRQLGSLVEQVDYNTLQDVSNALFQTGSTLIPSLFKGLGFFFAILANLLFVVFIAIFLLIEPLAYIKASLFLVPAKFHGRLLGIWSELYQTLIAWITTQFLSVSITMLLVWIVLGVLNVPGSQTIALFAGFATFIPNIGAFLPLLPIAFFILVQPDPQPALLLRAIPAYLVIQFLESNILTPRLIKSQLDIPSGALLFFQVIASTLFGAIGLLLAVPMLATLITLIRELYAYDLLKLSGKTIDVITLDSEGTLALRMPGWHGDDEEAAESKLALPDLKWPALQLPDLNGMLQRLGSLSLFRPTRHSHSAEDSPAADGPEANSPQTTTPHISQGSGQDKLPTPTPDNS